jgi:hypothetical protein
MVQPQIIGEHPLAKDPQGKLKSRIGTVFPFSNTIVTLPGIHATQRMAYLEIVNQQRVAHGLPPMTRQEESLEWADSVDLIMEDDTILIRPDPENMELAFRADERLQELVPKHKIKFLYVLNERVREAIKRRGENWRSMPLPQSTDDMQRMIAASSIGIGGKEIYYYSKNIGTRFLTYQRFAQLADLADEELRVQLEEIQRFSGRVNPHGCPEIAFFMADRSFSKTDFTSCNFPALDGPALRETYAALVEKFHEAVRPQYRRDDENDTDWRSRMCMALLGSEDQVVPEEVLLGMSSEFFMQIDWLPGGRIEEGELIFDTVFEDRPDWADDPELKRLRDEKARGFIFNFVREYGDLEYVNIGRIGQSLARRASPAGRRDVYVAQVKQRGIDEEIVKIIRMQRWGVREHLDCGKPLLQAIMESEEYTEYILDRRLACRQLRMNLSPRTTGKRISEQYYGPPGRPSGIIIWSTYFERDYVRGIASDKIPNYRLADETYALRLFHLLGDAAAPNMIVGRCDPRRKVIFDDGDEVVVDNDQGLPVEIVVADHTGTFMDFHSDLLCFAEEYAEPVNRRLPYLAHPEQCANLYVEAFVARFNRIQAEYRKRKRAFDTLFKHRHWDEGGSLAYRWSRVLERLSKTNARALGARIRQHIDVPGAASYSDASFPLGEPL